MKQLIQCMGMLMLLFGLSSRVSAQITLVKDGKATSRIVLVEKNEVNEQAATLLQDFVKRISQLRFRSLLIQRQEAGTF